MYVIVPDLTLGADFEHALQDDRDGQTVAVFHKDDRRLAEKVAVLLNSAAAPARVVDSTKAGARRSKPRSSAPSSATPLGVSADGMYGPDGPQAGKVYDILTGEPREQPKPKAKPKPSPKPAAPSRPVPPSEDEPDTWEACGASINVWPSGRAYVRFPSRPDAAILEMIRGAGFRWRGVRRGWCGQASALPARFAKGCK